MPRITIYNKSNPGRMIILPDHDFEFTTFGKGDIAIYSNELHNSVNVHKWNAIDEADCSITPGIGREQLPITTLSGDVDFIDD